MAKHKPITDDVVKGLSYDAETGILIGRSGKPKIKPAACGYIMVNGYLVHRLAWYMHYGEDPGDKQIDHIDRNKSNNKINNLRLVDLRTNHHNRSDQSRWGIGVVKKPNCLTWVASIKLKGEYRRSCHKCPLLAGLWYQDQVAALG